MAGKSIKRFKLVSIAIVFFISGNFSFAGGNSSEKVFFISHPATAISVASEYRYQVRASDSMSSSISISAIVLPGWLSFDPVSKTIKGKTKKAGQYLVDLIAFNKTDTAHQRFMLTVTDKGTTNILCLGNSITNGTNKFNSYRRALWQLLHAGNYNFDLIGSWDKHHMGGEVPNADFDMDHEGHSGWRFDEVFTPPSWDSARGNINQWLQFYRPDIVLLELGTNDVFQCRTVKDMITDLGKLVTAFRSKNKEVKILLAQIPPLGKEWASKKICGDNTDYDSAIRNLNNAFAEFAEKNSTNSSKIEIVDQYNGIDTGTQMYDDIHPNDAGEKIMAQKWFAALHKYLYKLH